MSDLSDRLEKLAGRGAPDGVDAVLSAARTRADDLTGAGAEPDALDAPRADEPRKVLALVDPEPVNLERAPRRRRRRRFGSVVAAGGVAASLFVGVLAIGSFVGSGGGAGSPEAAVRQLADAVSHEDALAAADVLAPQEVRNLRGTIDGASKRAQELALAKSAAAPFAGVDLSVNDLNLSTESLGAGYAKVSVVGGTISAHTSNGQFSPLMQRVLRNSPDGSSGSADLATLRHDPSTFVMTVEHDGHWYVSPAYTVLEYVREGQHLPAADFGSGQRAIATLGADTPEAAVGDAMHALAAADWLKLWSLAPPDEIPAYDYRAALGQLYADTKTGFTIDKLDTKATIDGDTAKVSLNASGLANSGSGRWSLDGACFTFPGEDSPPAAVRRTCGPNVLSIFPIVVYSAGDQAQVTAVRENGRWFVSPVGTVLDLLDHAVSSLTQRTLYTFLNIADQLPPDGALALGRPVTITDSAAGAYVYSYAGHQGEQLLGAATITPPDPSYDFSTEVRIFGPDGNELDNAYGLTSGQPVSLPADGTYKFVVQAYYRDVVFTIWDAADAPESVKNPPQPTSGPCTYTVGGGETCQAVQVPPIGSSATSSTVPGG